MFSFAIGANWNKKLYIFVKLPLTTKEANPTMMTSASEIPGNGKRLIFRWTEMFC